METLPAAAAAALWTALNLFVLLTLSVLVVRQRGKHKIAVGDGGVPELVRAQRAFGNASEYIPAAIAGLVALTLAGAPAPIVHAAGALLLIGRVAHAIGFSGTAGLSFGRTAGMIATWLAYVFLGVALLYVAVVAVISYGAQALERRYDVGAVR